MGELSTFLAVNLPFASVGFINQASRIVVGTLGPAMALEFGLSASGLGALAAVLFATYTLAQLPVGLAIDLHGPRRVQVALSLVAALGFILCALAPDPLWLGLGRVVTGIGIGIAGVLIGQMKANIQWFPPHRLAAVTGAGVVCGAAGGLAATLPVQAIQSLLIAQTQGVLPLFLLWFGFACLGSVGPISYSVLAQRFPPELTGRVATMLNFSMPCIVFLLQTVIGLILDQWPRTAFGRWDPADYSWALCLTVSLQGLTVLWLLADTWGRVRLA